MRTGFVCHILPVRTHTVPPLKHTHTHTHNEHRVSRMHQCINIQNNIIQSIYGLSDLGISCVHSRWNYRTILSCPHSHANLYTESESDCHTTAICCVLLRLMKQTHCLWNIYTDWLLGMVWLANVGWMQSGFVSKNIEVQCFPWLRAQWCLWLNAPQTGHHVDEASVCCTCP